MRIQSATYGQGNKRVVFLLGGWHSRLWLYQLVGRRIAKGGFRCIVYTYGKDVFSKEPRALAKNIKKVSRTLLSDIDSLKDEGCNNFSIMAYSIGALPALMTANKSPDISNLVLNMAGFDLVAIIESWGGFALNPRKKLVNKQDYGLSELKALWQDITPKNNLSNLKGKRILLYISKTDRMIPYEQGFQLLQALRDKNYDVKVFTNKYLGHTPGGIYNFLNAKIYLDFLK